MQSDEEKHYIFIFEKRNRGYNRKEHVNPRGFVWKVTDMETERKFLILKPIEDYREYPSRQIEQAYLCTQGCTIRIRKLDDTCYLTLKRNLSKQFDSTAIVNHEVEEEIPLSSYEYLLSKVDGQLVRKRRYYIPHEDHIIELDVFEGPLSGLVMAEIEYDSLDEIEDVSIPDWFGPEVTQDKRFRNSHLSTLKDVSGLLV